MKIGIDLDDCLAEFAYSFLNWHNDKYETSFEIEDVKRFNFWETIGGTRGDIIDKVSDFYKTNYFRNLPVVFGAVNGINQLCWENELFVVSSRPNDIYEETKKWIDQHFHDKFSEVILTNEWSLSGKAIKKADVCKKLGVDLYIDDNLENVIDCAKPKKNIRVFLFDRPWNQNSKLLKIITRVYNWNEILEKIEK